MLKQIGLIGTLFASLMAPAPAAAWGAQGHKLIAQLAYDRLTSKTKREVEAIIAAGQGGDETTCALSTFIDASTWPDCVRGRRTKAFSWTGPMHYEDRPLCSTATEVDPCPNGLCVTHAVETALAVVKDPKSEPIKRLQALAYVVHFVGDLHQPLHLTDNGDKGGNAVQVLYPRHTRPQNLHTIWDTQLVKAAVGGDNQKVWRIEAKMLLNGSAWAKGSVEDWAAQSHQLGVDVVYKALPQPPPCGGPPSEIEPLSKAYVDRALPVIEDQLGRSAVRLAALLNGALG